MNKEKNTQRVQPEWWKTMDTVAAPRELYQDLGTCSTLMNAFSVGFYHCYGSVITVCLPFPTLHLGIFIRVILFY